MIRIILITFLFFINTLWGSVAVLNGLAHEFNVTPGNIYKGQIELKNASEIAQVVNVYQTNMATMHTGETFYSDSLVSERSNMDWIQLSNLNITLESEKNGTIDFEIHVPNSSNLSGTYWSVIMIEPRDPIHVQQDESGYSIQSKVRYAIQIVCNIGETGVTDLQFLNISQEDFQGKHYLEVNVQNTGEVLVKPTLSLELFDANGNNLPIIKAEKQRIFPNSSKRYIIEIEGIDPGVYQGILIADCNTDDLFGVNVTLHLKDDQ